MNCTLRSSLDLVWEIEPVLLAPFSSKYGGLDVSEAKCLRSLELENAKLKRWGAVQRY